MLKNRPDGDICPPGDSDDRRGRAGLGDHGLGGRDHLAARLDGAPIAAVAMNHLGRTFFVVMRHGIAAPYKGCFAHFRVPKPE